MQPTIISDELPLGESAWARFFRSVMQPLTLKGFLWAVVIPLCWMIGFHAFVVHVRLSLGRWPAFGEQLKDWPLLVHYYGTGYAGVALAGSLYLLPVVAIVCLFLPRWRHLSVYAVTYGVAVAIAIGSLFLAPHPFLNWYFD